MLIIGFILGSIDSIDSFLGAQRDFNTYLKDKMLRRAVEREIEIIGEAINRIMNIDSDIEISGSRQIIGMRNRVIHCLIRARTMVSSLSIKFPKLNWRPNFPALH